MKLNENGVAVFAATIAVGIVIAILFLTTLNTSNQAARTRDKARKVLFIQEVFQNAAIVIHDSYLRTKGGGCATPILQYGGINGPSLCLPAPGAGPLFPGCIPNVHYPANPFCLTNALNVNGSVAIAPVHEKNDLHAWFFQALEFIDRNFEVGLSVANAQGIDTLPPVPANPPILPPPNPGTAVTCNNGPGTFYCVTVRLCRERAVCANSVALFQRFGFAR